VDNKIKVDLFCGVGKRMYLCKVLITYMAERADFIEGRKPVTFVDLFAGAGGISEGFFQAYTDSRYYDFVLASDINENCELTHRVRYNGGRIGV
jgi:hypothetical protein